MRVARGAPERQRVVAGSAGLDHPLELAQPVGQHLGRVREHLARAPRRLGTGAEVVGERPRLARDDARPQGGERGPRAAEALERLVVGDRRDGERIGHGDSIGGRHAPVTPGRGRRLDERRRDGHRWWSLVHRAAAAPPPAAPAARSHVA